MYIQCNNIFCVNRTYNNNKKISTVTYVMDSEGIQDLSHL